MASLCKILERQGMPYILWFHLSHFIFIQIPIYPPSFTLLVYKLQILERQVMPYILWFYLSHFVFIQTPIYPPSFILLVYEVQAQKLYAFQVSLTPTQLHFFFFILTNHFFACIPQQTLVHDLYFFITFRAMLYANVLSLVISFSFHL